jgi:hypothetical protein
MTHTIATTTICTECTPDRARRAVAYMQERGWNVKYGERTNIPSNDEKFAADFYKAVEVTFTGR